MFKVREPVTSPKELVEIKSMAEPRGFQWLEIRDEKDPAKETELGEDLIFDLHLLSVNLKDLNTHRSDF